MSHPVSHLVAPVALYNTIFGSLFLKNKTLNQKSESVETCLIMFYDEPLNSGSIKNTWSGETLVQKSCFLSHLLSYSRNRGKKMSSRGPVEKKHIKMFSSDRVVNVNGRFDKIQVGTQ